MVSSTFKDLEEHRAKLIKTLHRQKLFAIEIEDRSSKPDDDVIPSSLNMVRDASGYIGLTSHRYGQVPEDDERNPGAYSMTRLGFEEAKRLGLPTLIFVMGADHPVKAGDVEIGPEKRVNLEAFRQRAEDGRIYVGFENLEEFVRQAIHNVSNLAEFLDGQAEPVTTNVPDRSPVLATTEPEPDVIPSPPAVYAEPAYIGSHEFVGCNAQLEVLNDWAAPADAHPVLLYEAIGGAGKSMLTWEWVTNIPPMSATTGQVASGTPFTKGRRHCRLLQAPSRIHDRPAAQQSQHDENARPRRTTSPTSQRKALADLARWP